GVPPLGQGAHEVTIGSNGNETELFRSTVLDGTRLADLDHLDYSTYAAPTAGTDPGTRQPGFLRLTVSSDGTGTPDTSLFYEPALNAPDAVADNQWQTWQTADGTFTTTGDASGETTLAAFVNAHPD